MSASPRVIDRNPPPAALAPKGTRICFVGIGNLPVLAREYNQHPIGGEQVQQTLLAKACARLGYQVSMVTADYGQAEGATWEDVRTHKAFGLDEGLPVLRFLHPRWTGLWRAMHRAQADLYYTSCSGAIVGQIAMFCQRYNRKMVFRAASDADCEADLPLVKYWRDKQLYRYGLKRADFVLVQSNHQRELLKKNFNRESTVAGMLVDAGEAQRSFDERDFQALWVNNFRPLKRPDIFLDTAGALPELRFHIAGGAAPGYQNYYDDITAQARTRVNVTVHGQVPYHDVNQFYERARVFVNTSEIEGFPNSYLQAWIRGTPVVAFFDPDGLIAKEGLGVAVRTSEQLVDAVRMLATDQAAWNAASNRCLQFMDRQFGEKKVLAPYVSAFDRLLVTQSRHA